MTKLTYLVFAVAGKELLLMLQQFLLAYLAAVLVDSLCLVFIVFSRVVFPAMLIVLLWPSLPLWVGIRVFRIRLIPLLVCC